MDKFRNIGKQSRESVQSVSPEEEKVGRIKDYFAVNILSITAIQLDIQGNLCIPTTSHTCFIACFANI